MNWTDNYKWMFRVHLIGGGIVWAPHMERRTTQKYRLKSARGLFTIRKVSELERCISRVPVTPVVTDFMLHPVYDRGKRLPWEISKRGTTIPLATATPLRTFYILYNYARKPYKTGGMNK